MSLINWLASPQGYILTPWDEMEQSLHGLNRRMQDMDRQYNDVMSQFLNLNPSRIPVGDRHMAGGLESLIDNAVVTAKDGSRKFRLQYDVRNFRPEDIKVKTADNKLEVSAKCEEGDDNHKMYREYRRVCTLPEGLNPENLKSIYTPDGMLAIEAPLPAVEPPKGAKQEQNKLTEPVPIAIEHSQKGKKGEK